MKLLFFGDIVGKGGRRAVAQVLPTWRERYQPDIVVGNVENLAHGKGVTESTLDELIALGFTAFTLGDHALSGQGQALLEGSRYPLVRPANLPVGTPGRGVLRLSLGSRDILIINLIGQVFLREEYGSPFKAVDEILERERVKGNVAGTFIDIHAEATSEKQALGWYLDGRVTAVLGTHTHVPTADAWILPKGTAYVTDVGMVGMRASVIGVKTELSLERFLTGNQVRFEPVEVGEARVSAVLVTFDPALQRASLIERLESSVVVA